MNPFKQVLENHKNNLELYVPVVARVHGPTHPVFYDVQKGYDAMIVLVNEDKYEDLKAVFENLRAITDHYKIPSDTCETYEAVYNMLNELDQAYTQS